MVTKIGVMNPDDAAFSPVHKSDDRYAEEASAVQVHFCCTTATNRTASLDSVKLAQMVYSVVAIKSYSAVRTGEKPYFLLGLMRVDSEMGSSRMY